MRIVLISDTHGLHGNIGSGQRAIQGVAPKLPEGDMIIHAGDLGESKADTRNFLHWFDSLDYKHKLFIAGNHDRYVQDRPEDFYSYSDHYKTIKYLFDEQIEVEGIKIYGSPWTRNLPRWAFQVLDEEAAACWSLIPEDTDILVTHGPPYGILDEVSEQYLRGREDAHVGCKALMDRVKEIKPKLHVFGHIHEGRGIHKLLDTTFVNASMLDENYYFWPAEAITFDI